MVNHCNKIEFHIDIHKSLKAHIYHRLLDLGLVARDVHELNISQIGSRGNYLHLLTRRDQMLK